MTLLLVQVVLCHQPKTTDNFAHVFLNIHTML